MPKMLMVLELEQGYLRPLSFWCCFQDPGAEGHLLARPHRPGCEWWLVKEHEYCISSALPMTGHSAAFTEVILICTAPTFPQDASLRILLLMSVTSGKKEHKKERTGNRIFSVTEQCRGKFRTGTT